MERTLGNIEYFPAEALTKVFRYVDLHTLVFSCRPVCRYWKEVIQGSQMWKIKILDAYGSNKVANDSALALAHLHHPWYVCYALCRHVFNTNLFVFNEGTPLFWRDAQSTGFVWSAPLGTYTQGFPQIPQQLLDEGGSKSFLCAIGNCRINHSVDLYARGLTRKILEFQPHIHVSEWYGARYGAQTRAICHTEVKLFDSQWTCDTLFDHFRYQNRIGWGVWRNVSHTFTSYNPDVRYVVFHHGIDTSLPSFFGRFRNFQFGSAASQMIGTKVLVELPELSGSSSLTASSVSLD